MGRARVDEKLVSKDQITSDLSSCVRGSHAGHGASAAIQPTGLLKLTQDLREKARALGFDLCRITAAELPSVIGERLQEWLALGAHGVFLGRAYVYGLGALGEAGVRLCLNIIEREISLTMGFCGQTDINKLSADMLML